MAVLEVEGRSHVSGILTAGTVGYRDFSVQGLSLSKFDELAKDPRLPQEVRNVLVRARQAQAELLSAADDLADFERDRSDKLEEIERRRADLVAMGDTSSASRKTATRIAELEGEIDRLRGDVAGRTRDHETASERRDTILGELPG